MTESSVDYKSLYEELLDENSVLKARISELKIEVAAAPPKDSYIYLFFNPWTMQPIYGGKGSMFSQHCREEEHFLGIGRRNPKVTEAIKQSIEQGGVGIIRLDTDMHSHEAAGAECAVICYLKSEGCTPNENNGSRQGSYADMTLDELQDAGRKLVEEGLQKWREGGRIVYVDKVEPNSPANVKPFNDYVKANTILKICRSNECNRLGELVKVETSGLCLSCARINICKTIQRRCEIIELGIQCPNFTVYGAVCEMHRNRKSRAKKSNKELHDYSVDFIKNTTAKCGKCEAIFGRSALRVKHAAKFYHPKCLSEIYVPDKPASEFHGYNKLTAAQQSTLDDLFPGKEEEESEQESIIDEDLSLPLEERLDIMRNYILKAKLNESFDYDDRLLNEAERLDLKSETSLLLAQELFTEGILDELDDHRDLLLDFCSNDKRAQRNLIGGIEQFLEKNPELMENAPDIIQALLDNDLCSEDVLFSWGGGSKPSSEFVSAELSRKIIELCKPVFTWLKEAEEESSEDEDDRLIRKRQNSIDSSGEAQTLIKKARRGSSQQSDVDTDENEF